MLQHDVHVERFLARRSFRSSTVATTSGKMGCMIGKSKDKVNPGTLGEDDSPATTQDIMNLFSGNKEGQDYANAEKISKLQFSKSEVKHIYDVFNTVDMKGSSVLDIDTFCSFFKVGKSPFAERCFRMIDSNGSGTIDFTEFIMSVWNYCTFDMPSLIHFAFNFYDVGNSGMLTMDEAKGLIKEVYGEDAFEKNKELQQEISEVDMDKDGNISFEEFKDWVVRSPVILYPAFHMQQNIRKKVLGKKFWQKKRDQRIVWGNRSGKVLTLYDLLGDDEEVITQITDSKVAFANQMKNWSEKNPNSNITNKRDKTGRRKKRTTVALVPDKMKANFQAPGQNNSLEPIGEDDGVPSRERNFTEELQQIDEEMEQVGEALSKDKELKKIEEEMDL